MPIESVVSGLYEGEVLYDLIRMSLMKLKQTVTPIDGIPTGNFTRYPKHEIKKALSFGEMEAVRLTKCLHSFAIIRLKEGYSQYKPPTEFLGLKQAYFYASSTSYWELKQRTEAWLNAYQTGWRTTDGDPTVVYPGDSYGNLRKLGFYPTPQSDGDDYTLSPETGIYASESSMSTSGNVTGTNSAASATVCTDGASRTLSDEGVAVGMTAVNVTDGSTGQITAVAASTFTVAALTGGTANTWAVGDSFMVLSGEYGVVVDWAGDEEYLFSSEIGGMVDVTDLEGNVYITFYKRPRPLTLDTQRPEIPPEFHQYLPEYVPFFFKRTAPKGSQDWQEAQTAYQVFMAGIMGYKPMESTMKDAGFTRCWPLA